MSGGNHNVQYLFYMLVNQPLYKNKTALVVSYRSWSAISLSIRYNTLHEKHYLLSLLASYNKTIVVNMSR